MTCNALGSLCGNFCDSICKSCTMNCGNKNNVIIIGAGQVSQELLNGQKGLMEVITQQGQINPSLSIKTRTVRRLELKDDSQEGILQGIYETALRLVFQLTLGGEPITRGWAKLRLAGASCEVSLETKYSDREALTEKELKTLTKAVQKVSQYYLSAIFLWKIGKKRNFKNSRIRMLEDIPQKPMQFLKKKLSTVEKQRLRDPHDFFSMDLQVQAIYLEAAFLVPKSFRIVLLTQETIIDPIEVLHESGSSKLRWRVLQTPEPLALGPMRRANSMEFEAQNSHHSEEGVSFIQRGGDSPEGKTDSA